MNHNLFNGPCRHTVLQCFSWQSSSSGAAGDSVQRKQNKPNFLPPFPLRKPEAPTSASARESANSLILTTHLCGRCRSDMNFCLGKLLPHASWSCGLASTFDILYMCMLLIHQILHSWICLGAQQRAQLEITSIKITLETNKEPNK